MPHPLYSLDVIILSPFRIEKILDPYDFILNSRKLQSKAIYHRFLF